MSESRRVVIYAVAFLVWTVAVGVRWLAAFDLHTTLLLQHAGRPWLDRALFGFTLIGSIESTCAIVAAVCLWRWCVGDRRTAIALGVAFIILTLIEVGLKFRLPQPHVPRAFDRNPWGLVGWIHISLPYAFPSGHALRSVFLLGYLGDLVMRRRAWWRALLGGGTIILIGMICVSRVYLGDHWASDVIGSCLLASAGLWGVQWMGRRDVTTASSA